MGLSYSAQGRYQSRAAEGIAVRGDHDFQPTPHDITSSNLPSHFLFHFIIKLNHNQIPQGVPSILFLSFNPSLVCHHVSTAVCNSLRRSQGNIILESQFIPPQLDSLGDDDFRALVCVSGQLYLLRKTARTPTRCKA